MRIDIVITGIYIAVMFDDDRSSAGGLMMTYRAGHIHKARKSPLDIHDKNVADILFTPGVKNADQKLTIING